MGGDEEDARGDEGFNKGGGIVFRGLWGKPTVASAAGETLMRDVQKGDKVGTRFSFPLPQIQVSIQAISECGVFKAGTTLQAHSC